MRSESDVDEIAALNELIAEQRRTIRSLMHRADSPAQATGQKEAAVQTDDGGSPVVLSAKLARAHADLRLAAESEGVALRNAEESERAAGELRRSCAERDERARHQAEAHHGEIETLQRRLSATELRAHALGEQVERLTQENASKTAIIARVGQFTDQQANELDALRHVVDELRNALKAVSHSESTPVGSARAAVLNSPRRTADTV